VLQVIIFELARTKWLKNAFYAAPLQKLPKIGKFPYIVSIWNNASYQKWKETIPV
jgi:hypothetical protein